MKKIKIIDFNQFLRESKANFLICDIEGGEHDIFTDQTDLSRIDKISIEMHPVSGKSVKQLFDFFIAKGFKSSQSKPGAEQQCVYFFARQLPPPQKLHESSDCNKAKLCAAFTNNKAQYKNKNIGDYTYGNPI